MNQDANEMLSSDRMDGVHQQPVMGSKQAHSLALSSTYIRSSKQVVPSLRTQNKNVNVALYGVWGSSFKRAIHEHHLIRPRCSLLLQRMALNEPWEQFAGLPPSVLGQAPKGKQKLSFAFPKRYLNGPRLRLQAPIQCGACKKRRGRRSMCNSIAFIIRLRIYQGPHDIRSMPGSRAAKAEMPAAKAKVSTKPPALSDARACS